MPKTVCAECGSSLTYNEIGATKRFINRSATEYFCFRCLAKKLGCSETLIMEKIRLFKKQGCTLFV